MSLTSKSFKPATVLVHRTFSSAKPMTKRSASATFSMHNLICASTDSFCARAAFNISANFAHSSSAFWTRSADSPEPAPLSCSDSATARRSSSAAADAAWTCWIRSSAACCFCFTTSMDAWRSSRNVETLCCTCFMTSRPASKRPVLWQTSTCLLVSILAYNSNNSKNDFGVEELNRRSSSKNRALATSIDKCTWAMCSHTPASMLASSMFRRSPSFIKARPATPSRALRGQGWNTSSAMQLISAGNLRPRTRNELPAGEWQRIKCKFLRTMSKKYWKSDVLSSAYPHCFAALRTDAKMMSYSSRANKSGMLALERKSFM
mmetsp:Transcript_90026/g.275567  ORF Transcript_90026/g.275567 Transcript_90026/m.275567 type:complete len:320 (-) Transcript_90026:1116-2075(-)